MAYSPDVFTVKVEPDMLAAMDSVKRMMRDTLINYSEWLDTEGLMRPVEDTSDRAGSTHEDLVKDFLNG